MELLALILSIIVMIALVIIAIILFVYVNKMGHAIKDLEQKVEVMDARNYDNDVLLDNDVRSLKGGLAVTSSNVASVGSSWQSALKDLNVVKTSITTSDANWREAASNNFYTLAQRDNQIMISLSNMASNCVKC